MGSSRGRQIPEPVTKAALEAWVESGRPCRLTTVGKSMLPLLPDGCQVIVKRCSEGIKLGDIAIYFLDKTLIAHRIVKITNHPGGRLIQTKGDSSLYLDADLINESEIVGRVAAAKIGERTIDLRSPVWRAAGRLVAFSSYCIGSVGSWVRGRLRALFQ